MTVAPKARLRRLWLNIHLWLGIGLCLLLVPIGLSGSFLVWHDHFDAMLNPARYAATKGEALPASELMSRASAALGRGFEPFVVRLPEGVGWPATVSARERRGERQSGRPRVVTVYLDPPTGRVLDTVEFRTSIVGFLHRFHENLTIPEYSGRAIVGWSGVAMLILSLSGIYLWWPRHAGFLRGLRWRRGPEVSFNLHHLVGIWIALPLAVVSATGIYLGFPQQGRQLLASVAPMTPPQRGSFGAPLMRDMAFTVDVALVAAMGAAAGARPAAVFLPTQATRAWRVQLRDSAHENVTVIVDDRSGAATKIVQLAGDRTASWIRWIHEGSRGGPLWQILVFVTGLVPTIFAVTGTMIWLRKRRARQANEQARGIPQLDAAE